MKKKKKAIVICVLIFIISLFSIFARYIMNRNTDFYSRTKEFYFYSDKLGEDNPVYQIENWSGVGEYPIIVKMSSNKNDNISTKEDIPYNISYTCTENIKCSLSKESSIIYSNVNSDQFTLVITPNSDFQTGDVASVTITAQATSPYEKTLSAKFNLVIGKESISYEIEDSAGSPYLEVKITNTLSYYKVNQSFGAYNIGAKISRDIYVDLSDVDKEKCSSIIITLGFNPNEILLDMTDNNYINSINSTEIPKGSYDYINSVTFKVDAIASTKVKFYKIDQTKDYTYPKQGNVPIVNVTSI